MILPEIDKLKDIIVPRLKVDRKGTRSLVATLVDVSRRVVVYSEHRNNAIGRAIGPSNVGTSGSDSVDVETNTTGSLGNHGTGLQGVIDTLDTVRLHIDQETRGQLSLRSASIEQCR